MLLDPLFCLLLILLLAGTAWLAYVSRASLLKPHSHGFARFFAWECILLLFLLNVRTWFREPFTPLHLLSWLLLLLSAFLVVDAVYLLRRYGRLDEQRQDATLVGVEKTTVLVTQGIYRYIRHPMYSSLLCLAWGICLKDPSWMAVGLAAAATFCVDVTARLDEAASLKYFGLPYWKYMQRTKRYIPFLF